MVGRRGTRKYCPLCILQKFLRPRVGDPQERVNEYLTLVLDHFSEQVPGLAQIVELKKIDGEKFLTMTQQDWIEFSDQKITVENVDLFTLLEAQEVTRV